MTLKRLLLALGLVGFLAGAALVADKTEAPGLRMTGAAEKFLASLEPKQKAKAGIDFDSAERTRWFFTPQQTKGKATRKGLPLAEMSDKQKDLALALVRAGTSESGYKKATMIMALESILADLEKGKTIVRDPDWYFFSVFGTPSRTGKWGWRVEGHHLSLNFTLDGGKLVSATPFVFGANPAEVKAGKSKGQVTLPGSMNGYRELIKLLDDDQKKVAEYRDKNGKPARLPEIHENEAKPSVGAPIGLAAAKMNDKQKAALKKLVEGYAGRMPPEVAAQELAEIEKVGFDKIHFAYGGGDGTPGKPYTYRIQGPTFLIEFLNEQADSARNPANHIHSGWRNMKGDFGLTP